MGYDKRIAELMIARYNNGVKSIGADTIDKSYNMNEMVKEKIDNAAKKLMDCHFVTIEYQADETTKIRRLVIDESKAVEFAASYGMKTKEILTAEVNEILKRFESNRHRVVHSFCQQQRRNVAKNRAIAFVNKQSSQGLEDVMIALNGITTNTADISIYDLSQRLYNDRKKLVELLPSLYKIISSEYENEIDFLQENHVFISPLFTVVKGNGKLTDINGKTMEVSNYIGTIQVSDDFIKDLASVEANKIVIMESRESFDKFNIDNFDGLIMFIDSYSSDTNVNFLQKTKAPIYYHGNLDARSIKIMENLEERVQRPVVNPLLTVAMYEEYKHSGKRINEFNKKWFRKMMLDEHYNPQNREIIEKMLEENITIKCTVVDPQTLY